MDRDLGHPAPPASADWVAVVFLQPVSGVCVPPDCSPVNPPVRPPIALWALAWTRRSPACPG